MNLFSREKSSYLSRGVVLLLIVNVAVNLLSVLATGLSSGVEWLSGFSAAGMFALPSDFGELMSQPWTVLTYMFFHSSPLHLVFNLLALVVFGNVLASAVGNLRLIWIYLAGGLAGAVVYTSVFGLMMGRSNVLVGASAAVLAVIVAAAILCPHVRLSFYPGSRTVGLRTAAWVFLLIVLIGLAGDNAGGGLAHIGGALAGAACALSMKKSFRPSGRDNSSDEIRRELDALQMRITQSGFSSLSDRERRRFFYLSATLKKS